MCETIETYKHITREENGRSLEVLNPARWEIGVVQVDGCLITDTKRCDWMIRLPAQQKLSAGIVSVKLVELKGKSSKVQKAFEQLDATLEHPAIAADKNFINECFVVTQLTPSFSGTIQNLKVQFQANHGIKASVVSCAKIDVDNP